jgi:hypothetical protein
MAPSPMFARYSVVSKRLGEVPGSLPGVPPGSEPLPSLPVAPEPLPPPPDAQALSTSCTLST